ncbi:hypothetical protein GVO57_04465 [Sphingomonas changnyeongensis]|uniref:ADP-heptose:LPS heptosyltransferase n=1 Tax=Sphingomonas changnyeongensis TaxID=2698679 RepID=A0A7Z2S4M1_9SPHN|nr:hypothetical protein [Sphingomonas changnyeongensis]QHL90225.1 hypothetical protein GVO57_04465 [Sphingomonas changnyeongensis]
MAECQDRPVCFLQLKAFGDFVIANAAAERVAAQDRQRVTIAIGTHLQQLCEAVAPTVPVITVASPEASVPAIFDIRKLGLSAALKSAWQVRRAVERAAIGRDALILVDGLGMRERFVIGSRPAIGMSAATANIYHGYDALLQAAGIRLAPAQPARAATVRRAGIFPGSRIAAKNLPVALVADLLNEAGRRGVSTDLYLLQGERPDLEASGLPHIVMPRQFTALRAAIAGVDFVVSADSLPAHLAESLCIDSFVITPRPNEFWMPRSVFDHRRWGLFNEPGLIARIGALLSA